MTAPVVPKITITKLEAARRQLRVAISLWFQEGDEVAIHTLACAAHQIINDINQHRGGTELLFDSLVFREEYRKRVIARFKKEMNFFKHADRDPDPAGEIEFVPQLTETFIVSSLKGLSELFRLKPEPIEAAFLMCFGMRHPQFLTEKGRREFLEGLTVEEEKKFTEMSPRQFLKLYNAWRLNFGGRRVICRRSEK